MLRKMGIKIALAAFACAVSFTAQAYADNPQRIDIPASDLVSALEALARQSGAELVYQAEQLKGLNTRGVTGTLTSQQAVEKLLEGTPLVSRTDSSGAMLIALPRAPSAEASERASSSSSSQTATQTPAPPSASDKEVPKSFWERFRLAQTETRNAATTTETGAQTGEPKQVTLEEVIVTSQKREERLQDVPISISVLSGVTLDKSPYKGVTEALNFVPGVLANVENQSGGTTLSMRGVVPGAIGSSSVGYYLDAAPFGFIRYQFNPDPNVYDLERVEVLRGPQGTLYGASAQNGVVRVLTHDADLNEFEAKGRATLSDTDGGGENYRADLAVNVPIIEGKLAARAVVGYEEASGWVDRPNKQEVNEGGARNMRLKLNASPTDAMSLSLSAWHAESDYDGPAASDPSYRRNVLVDEPLDVEYDIYNARLTYDFSAFSLMSSSSYIDYQNEGILRSQLSATLFYTKQNSKVATQELNLSSTGEGRLRWGAGAIYRHAQEELRQAFGPPPTLVFPPYAISWSDESESAAVFGEVGYRVLEKLELAVGLRYFEDDSTHDDNAATTNSPYHPSASFHATTPRVVLTWFASDDLTAYASYGEGFRSGVLQSSGARAFPAVKPDTLHNYEIGAKGRLFDGLIAFDTAAYYIKYDDAQQQLGIPFGSSFTAALVNAESASGPGFEAAVLLRPIDRLELGLNFSWNDLAIDADLISNGLAVLNEGERLNGSPEYTYGGSLQYAFPFGSGGLQGAFFAAANYQSERLSRSVRSTATGPQVGQTLGEPLWYSNAGFSIGPVSERWTVNLFVNNLLDEDNVVGPGTLGAQPDQTTRLRPRTYGVQLDVRL